MLGYVDNCLPRNQREAFEGRIEGNREVRNQIEQWLLQNEAIRAAFSGYSQAPTSYKSFAVSRTPLDLGALRKDRAAPQGPYTVDPAEAGSVRVDAAPIAPVQQVAAAKLPRSIFPPRLLSAFAGAVLCWAASAIVLAGEQSVAFLKAGTAAYRTFASGAHPVEIVTADRDVLNKWLAPRIGRVAPVPDLDAAGLSLLGGRLVPGAVFPAGFLFYENARRERVGLAVEALDSPSATDVEIGQIGGLSYASWIGSGHSYALIGRISGERIMELARLIREGQSRI